MPYELSNHIEASRLLIWEFGRPAELWRSHRHLAAELIKRHNLEPLAADDYPYLPMAVELGATTIHAKQGTREADVKLRWPIPFPGGIRIPHVHNGRDIYLLEADQWNEFSQSVVRDIQQRLAGTKEIGFDQMLQVGQAAASLTR